MLGAGLTVANRRKAFAVHPGEILKTEFMEPIGVSAYALAKALNFPGIYDVWSATYRWELNIPECGSCSEPGRACTNGSRQWYTCSLARQPRRPIMDRPLHIEHEPVKRNACA